MRYLVCFLALIGSSSCKKTLEGPIIPVKAIGVNGEAFYAKNPLNGEMIKVYKEEYITSPHYEVSIKDDSLTIGEKFAGYVTVYKNGGKINIKSPIEKELPGDSAIIEKFEFMPSKAGN